MSWDELHAFLENRLGKPLDMAEPRPLTPWQVIEALWPLRDVFAPVHARVRSLPYRPMFEADADEAIVNFAWSPSAETWNDLKPGVWRVLLERYEQMLTVCAANEAEGRPRMTIIPRELPEDELLSAQMLEWLLRMSLPWQPGDRSRDQAPGNAPAPSLRHQ